MGLAFKTHPKPDPLQHSQGSCPSHFPRALRRFGDRSRVICSTPPQGSPFGQERGQSPQAGPQARAPAARGSPCCPPAVSAAVPEQPGGLPARLSRLRSLFPEAFLPLPGSGGSGGAQVAQVGLRWLRRPAWSPSAKWQLLAPPLTPLILSL